MARNPSAFRSLRSDPHLHPWHPPAVSLTMHLQLFLAVFLSLLIGSHAHGSEKNDLSSPDKDGKYWIHGDGISAAFVPYGASISNLLINDKHGIQRDIIVGFDNASYYSI